MSESQSRTMMGYSPPQRLKSLIKNATADFYEKWIKSFAVLARGPVPCEQTAPLRAAVTSQTW